MKSRIFRAVICFVLICCLCVNMIPRRAEAVLLESYLAYGTVAALLLMSAGVVFTVTTQPEFEALGKSFYNSMYQWGTEAEQLDQVEEFFTGLKVYSSSSDDDDDDPDTPHEKQVKLAQGILAGIGAWIGGIILDTHKVEVEEEVTMTPSSWPTSCTYSVGDNTYEVTSSSGTSGFLPITYLNEAGSVRYFKVLSTGTSFIVNGSSKTKSGSFVYDDITLYQYSVSSASPSYAYSGFYHYDDIYSYLDFYPPTSTQTTIVTPSTYVGDIPEQVQSGELAPEEIPMPDLIDYELAFNYGADLAEAITNISQGMSTGEITFDDYKSIIGYVESPEVETSPSEDSTEATEPSEDTSTDPEPNVGSDDLASPVGDVSGTTFFEKLGSIVTFPFEWIWSKIETFFTTALKPELWLDPLPEIFAQPFEWIWEKIETFFEPLLNPSAQQAPFEWIWGKIEPIPGQITEAVSAGATKVEEAVNSLVVPDEDYLTDKVDALCAEFAFADSIVRTGQAISTGLAGVTTEPPVIYIDLGAARWGYDIGGRVPFIDMTWYAEYKPTADALISSFLWICFIWQLLIHLPGIISGASGVFTLSSMPSTQTFPIGSMTSGLELLSPSGNQGVPTYDEMLDEFFSCEPEDWLPGEYERYKAKPPSYAELLEWGYGTVDIED